MKHSDKGHKQRLQVFLSHSGVCSRRVAMDLIKDGHVRVNGKVNREPSTPVDPSCDRISVDNNEIQRRSQTYLLLNKPAGYVTTKTDRFDQATVYQLLPKKFHYLVPVGRLDKNTEGLLLFTNDGDVAYKLTHPKFNIQKIYFVRITGELTKSEQKKLEKGVVLEGKKTAPARITNVKNYKNQTELKIKIHEGRKRQIRLMFQIFGYKVIYLQRLSQGPLRLGNLQKGHFKELDRKEISGLKGAIK